MCALSACPRVHTSLGYLVSVATARGVRADVRRACLRTAFLFRSKVVGRAASRRGHEQCRDDGRTQPCAVGAMPLAVERALASDGADGSEAGFRFCQFLHLPELEPAPLD